MYAIVMAGGSGTRFWPASRASLPKQFLKITGDKSMFEQTVDRLAPIVDSSNILVVVNRLHEELTRKMLGADSPVRVLAEPVGRNTAACIGLAALHIAREAPEEPIVVLPADHFIANTEKFAATLSAASDIARFGAIATVGAVPTRPETGYGYIELGQKNKDAEGRSYYSVSRFVEKPDQPTALKYLSSGNYFWNCGIFAFTAQTILGELQACAPGLYNGLCRIDRAIGTPEYSSMLKSTYPELESISIDYAVMERTRAPIYVLPAQFGWSDVGSWQAVYELGEDRADQSRNLALGDALFEDSRGNLVYSQSDRVVALLGVEGLAVIDTPDALLVADIRRSQDVKVFPGILKSHGRN